MAGWCRRESGPCRVGTREISPAAGKAQFTWSLKVSMDREMGALGSLLHVTRLRSRCQARCDHLGLPGPFGLLSGVGSLWL